jgi:hypothetical protein
LSPTDAVAAVVAAIADPALEPDPDRLVWSNERERIAVIRSDLLGVLDPPGRAALGPTDPRAEALADLAGAVAALLYVSGERAQADLLLSRAERLAPTATQRTGLGAARREPASFALLVHAHWLEQRGRRAAANARRAQVAHTTREPALRAAAAPLADDPGQATADASGGPPPARGARKTAPPEAGRPVRNAPPLFTINGCGVTLYGARDARPDGSHIATYFVTILFVPVLPLVAYRVVQHGRRFAFVSREPLGAVTRWWRRLAIAAIAALVVVNVAGTYLNSPARRLGAAIAEARRDEARLGPDAAIARWRTVIDTFRGQVADHRLVPAAEAMTRLALARVPTPVDPAALTDVRAALAVIETLPDALRARVAQTVQTQLAAWADGLGGTTVADRRAALELVDHALGLGPSAALDARRRALGRGLAASIEASEPLAALRLYALEPDDDARRAVARLLEPIADDGDLLQSIEPDLTAWLGGIGNASPDTRALAERASAALARAKDRAKDATRQALLDGSLADLTAARAEAPHDQPLAVALARRLQSQDQLAEAEAVLVALGPVGRLTPEARLTLAFLARARGDVDRAVAIIEPILAWRQPLFAALVAEATRVETTARERLIDEMRRGLHDAELNPLVDGLPETEQQIKVGEWMSARVNGDPMLAGLGARLSAYADVPLLAISLGQLELERAQRATPADRPARLAAAERAYRVAGTAALGSPEYHEGLALVLFRLGRVDEGEKELAVLVESGARGKLGAAAVLRELGQTPRARTLLEGAWNDASLPADLRQVAAQQRALCAVDLDDKIVWLGRVDTAVARRQIAEIEGIRLCQQGKFGEGDKKLAGVAREWEAAIRRDGAAVNNAALAHAHRFSCTGDTAHIDRGLRLLEDAARREAGSAIVAANVATLASHRALLRAMAHVVQIETLRPDSEEASELFGHLAKGPGGAALKQALAKDPAFGRALAAMRQRAALAPQNPMPLLEEMALLALVDDQAGLQALATRTEAAERFDLTEIERYLAHGRAQDGQGPIVRDLRDRLAARRAVLADPPAGTTSITVAAAWLLVANDEDRLATVAIDAEAAGRAVEAVHQADIYWPEGVDEANLAAQTLRANVVIAASREPAQAQRLREGIWSSGFWPGAWRLAQTDEGSPLARTVRAGGSAGKLARALAKSPEPSIDLWFAGAFLDDAELSTVGARSFDVPRYQLGCRIRNQVLATLPNMNLECQVLAARGRPAAMPAWPASTP